MLEQLSIKNLVVVEDLSAEFQDGMTVITGETGAGKSIIVQALNLVSGGRSDATLVRHGKDKAEIVAMFQLGNNSNLFIFPRKLRFGRRGRMHFKTCHWFRWTF